jgi:hypothetical protein
MPTAHHRPPSAAQRTELLHSLLLDRYLAGTDTVSLGLILRPPDDCSDPIAVLVTRMRIDHQLDDNALRVIDDDARRLAGAE